MLNNVHTQLYFQTGAGDAADLAREIVGTQMPEEVRQTLMTQSVGEAYLVRRGQPGVRVRVPFNPDPPTDPARVQSLRDAALRRWGRPVAEVDRELEERLRLSSTEASSPKPPSAGPATEAADSEGVTPKGAKYEVRHVPVRAKFPRQKPPAPEKEDQ